MSDWRQGTLRDVLVESDERVLGADISLVLSVTEHRGIIPQTEVFTKRVATADVRKYRVLHPLDIAFNPYLLWTGAVGQWLGQEPGLTSPVYPVLRTSSGHDPRWVGLLLESGLLTPYFDSTAVGSIQRRRRTTLPVFFSAEVNIPPAATQRRIVAVIDSIDKQIAALDAERDAAEALLIRTLSSRFDVADGALTSIVNLCSLVVGGVWGSPEGENEIDVLALGPRIYTPGTNDFVTHGSPTRSFTKKQVENRLIQSGYIILERSGGSPKQPVGRVVIAGSGLKPCVPTDFQRLLRADPEKVNPRYLFWRLRFDWSQGVTKNYSRRTTGITNLSVRDYVAREIPVPDLIRQVETVALADAIDVRIASATSEKAALCALRSAVLNALLSREIEIPESFDKLLAVKVAI